MALWREGLGDGGGDPVKGHCAKSGFDEGPQFGVSCHLCAASRAVFAAVRINWGNVFKGVVNTPFTGGFKCPFKSGVHLIEAGPRGAPGEQGSLQCVTRALGLVLGHGRLAFNMRRTDTSETRSLRAISGTEWPCQSSIAVSQAFARGTRRGMVSA